MRILELGIEKVKALFMKRLGDFHDYCVVLCGNHPVLLRDCKVLENERGFGHYNCHLSSLSGIKDITKSLTAGYVP